MAKGKTPDFNVRAKVGEFWTTVGAAWHGKDNSISIRLNVLPAGGEWDGTLLMLPPREEATPREER